MTIELDIDIDMGTSKSQLEMLNYYLPKTRGHDVADMEPTSLSERMDWIEAYPCLSHPGHNLTVSAIISLKVWKRQASSLCCESVERHIHPKIVSTCTTQRTPDHGDQIETGL